MTKKTLRYLIYVLILTIVIVAASYITSIFVPGSFFYLTTTFFMIAFFRAALTTSQLIESTNDLNKQESLVIKSKTTDGELSPNQFIDSIDCFSVATIISDLNFNIVKLNKSAEHILNEGLKLNKNFLEIVNLSKEELLGLIEEHVNQNSIINGIELDLFNTDKTLLFYVSQNSDYYVFNVIDATKYKTLESSTIHSQKMQALGQLSGSIAHDFNNLLTAILGLCDLLLVRHPPGDKSFTELMQIKQNINRAANLVRQLLAFSRKQVMQPSIINVTDSIAELSILMTRLIGNDIELIIDHGKDIAPVKVDEGQFEQVIVNLAVNARDAMKKGGKLLISTKNITVDKNFNEKAYYSPIGDEAITPGKYVLISVADDGSGIPKNILDKIFEPFFSTKDASSGTGLGLATVFGIIKQTGGYIRIKTEENVGTTFFIFLKAIKDELANETDNKNTSSSIDNYDKIMQIGSENHSKILVVEDESPVRLFTTHALKAKGYEVLEADCAETALLVLDKTEGAVDLILTDVMMPGLTGPELSKKVVAKFPNIKFIFTSGYAEDAVNYLSNTSCHFLRKPYTLKELVTIISTTLGGK